jgi:hypothetical protein
MRPFGRRPAAALLIAAVVASLVPLAARADDGAIGGVAFDKASPQAGDVLTVQIAVAPKDGVWQGGSYSAHVALRTQDGAVIAESADVAGTSPTAAGQIVSVFVPVTIPTTASGPLAVRVTITHSGAVVGDQATSSIVVGAVQQGQVQPPTAPGGAPAAQPPPEKQKIFTADINTTSNYAATQAQQGSFTLGAKFSGDRSASTTFGLSDQPGAAKPLVGYQTKNTLTQVGTYSPSFDNSVLSGPSGTGITLKRPFVNDTLQIAFLSGAHATANPYTILALNDSHAVTGGTLTFTVGNVYVTGDPVSGAAFFMREGTFAGLQFAKTPNAANFGYTLRYGVIDYLDTVIGHRRTDRIVEATSTATLLKVGLTLDVIRAGPYFPNLTAPGITPDNEAVTLGATVPVGKFNLTGSINEYRQGLNGSPLTQNTHFWTESVGIDTTLRNGDSVGVKVSNAIQHQDGSQIAYSGNDNTGVTYNAKRGLYAFSFTVGSANQRSSAGALTHTIQDGVTVTRTVGEGLSANAGFSTTNALANTASSVNFLDAISSGLSWTRGPITLSSSINKSLSRPGAGIAAPASLALNYGLAVKPMAHVPYTVSVTAAQARGASASTTGALNVSRSL